MCSQHLGRRERDLNNRYENELTIQRLLQQKIEELHALILSRDPNFDLDQYIKDQTHAVEERNTEDTGKHIINLSRLKENCNSFEQISRLEICLIQSVTQCIEMFAFASIA